MKKAFLTMLSLMTISMSAQIVEFSDDLLSQYEDKKQEEILTRPIDMDSLYPSIDFDLAMIRTHSSSYQSFTYQLDYYTKSNIVYPNYIGYHIFIPESNLEYPSECVLSFSSKYDTIALGTMRKGLYEVVGMIVTKEDSEDIMQIVMDKTTFIKDNNNGNIGKCWYPYTFQKYCEQCLSTVGTIREINKNLHNKNWIDTNKTILVLKGEDGHFYYLHVDDEKARILEGAFLIEQYDYIKDFLMHNDWILGKPGKNLSITTKDGLYFHFADTVGVSIKNVAVKDGEFIAIMKVGADSILYSCSIEWGKNKYSNYEYVNSHKLVSDTLEYVSFKCDYYDSQLLIRRQDYAQIAEINKNFQDEVIAYRNQQEAEAAARKEAMEQARKEEFERLMKEIEQQRKLEKQSLVAKYGEKYGLLIFEHKVSLGMTKEMCLKAWGSPRNKIVRKTANGTQEIWTYGLAQYLIFVNGILAESASSY